MAGRYRFSVLGPLEVRDGETVVPISGNKLRMLLAALLVKANEQVSHEELIERLWGERPPANARRTLNVYVMRLRQSFPAAGTHELIRTTSGGYLLAVDPASLDLTVFRDTLAAARNAPDPVEESRLLSAAIALWRGPTPSIEDVGAVEQRQNALERRIEIDIELGRQAGVIGELRALTAEHPLRERLWALLLRALYRSDRQGEAIEAYQSVRRLLAEELGVDPGTELQRAYQQLLDGAQPEWTARDQLPPDIGHFIGRTEVLSQLTGMLVPAEAGTSIPIVTVVGPPGVGKTALAVHIAHQLGDAFPDGRLFANLRGYSRRPPMTATQALTQFLRTLGVPAEQVPLDVEEQSILLRSLLSGKRVLVVLDNAAGAEQVRALLPAKPGCAVLITSRDELRGLAVTHGARQVSLDVLGASEAQALLGELLGADRISAEQPRHCVAGPRKSRAGRGALRAGLADRAGRRAGDGHDDGQPRLRVLGNGPQQQSAGPVRTSAKHGAVTAGRRGSAGQPCQGPPRRR